jgi:spore maturation protein CgeB
MWRAGYRPLMEMYESLARATEGHDVLVIFAGANLHPEFVRQLNVFKVYTVGDPESAEDLGRPLCGPFDLVLVNHMADIPRYRSWGKEHVYFWPLGSLATEDDLGDLTVEKILDPGSRSVPAVFIAEYSKYRVSKMDRLASEFPSAFFAGRGWPRGPVNWDEMWRTYRHSRIGWNIHNTTGFNLRTYELPAYGVMEICDNKSDLSQVFNLNKEIIGYDTMDECIELTKYYLSHVKEQREIAAAGWLRWKKDYTPIRVWERLVEIVGRHFSDTNARAGIAGTDQLVASLHRHEEETGFNRVLYGMRRIFLKPLKRLLIRIARSIGLVR